MRRWIVDNVRPVDRSMIFSKLHDPEAMSTVFKPYQSLEASEK